MDKNKVGTMMQRAAKVPINELNECITCKLCRGYYIDATTIIECLHTFCRSCIVHYLESNKYCPICDVQVHKTKPLLNLRPDKTIQDLVYKLVPRLYQNEIQRRKLFYETHPEGKPSVAEQAGELQYDYILTPEETLNLTLNYHGCCSAPRYLRCPSAVLVTHLKKLIRAKYGLTEHHRVDVLYNQDCLNPSFSLMDISYIYSWKRKGSLDLTYKIYECSGAKKQKLEVTEKFENNVSNPSNNNNNNNWKEVQLRISENGEMSITGIEDSSMLELLDATENYKSEIVINEGKNLENFPKPVQVDTDIGNGEVKIQSNHSVSIDNHVKTSENAPSNNKQPENAQKPVENLSATSKKELPGLTFIGKSSTNSCTTSTITSMKSPCISTKAVKNSGKVANIGTKTGISASKTTNTDSKPSLDAKKSSINCTEAANTLAGSKKTSSTKLSKSSSDNKLTKNSMSLNHTMPKSMELSATLNLNSELSVIPLSASSSCVSLSSCGGTTTVFSTINKTMCSTRMDCSDIQNIGAGDDKMQGIVVKSKESPAENVKDSMVNSVPKETKNLKRKCEDDGKTSEVPAKLPKPTILNHSIGLMNLSNNHPLKKHSKVNRNGEHLLRTPELSEKVPISSPTMTVNHVSVPQKHISMDSILSKPIIINKNVSSLQISRPGTPKSGQKGGQGGNVPCYANKTIYNSIGDLSKLGERNGEKLEGTQEKTEFLNSAVNSIPKTSPHHPVHHAQSYQTSHHTPIITPSQLPHHQNLNSPQLKIPVCSNSAHKQEKSDQKTSVSNVVTSQSSVATSQVTTSHSNTATSHGNSAPLQSNLPSLKSSLVTSISNVTTQSNKTLISQKQIDVLQESSQPSNKPSVQSTPHLTTSNHPTQANTLNPVPSSIQNTPSTQAPPSTVAVHINHAPISIKTKPSTPIGYKTLRDPPKSWNSQINSQIARVNQNVKAQQLANAAAAAVSQGGVVNAQGRYAGDLKSVRPAKFFKGRNMPRYLGCPVSGVKPMYQVSSSEKDKSPDQQTLQVTKPEKSEIKKHSIVKIDPKTLRPISEKAPETSNLSNMSSSLVLNTSQSNQELRISSIQGDLKINTSSVSIFNPLKLQSSPKNERKSPKSPHSPKVKGSPNGNNGSAVTTSTAPSSPSPSNTLSPKQHRDKTNLTFTPPNPFVPNLTSPTLSPNQFLYPAGGFPSYDPRVMAAYHSLWYSQRMAAAAAAGFVPPPMPHAFGMNIGLNTGTTTIGQQQHNLGVSSKHSTSPKSSGQPSPRAGSATPTQISKVSLTPHNKKTKELAARNEKSLETALNKLSQNKAKELGENKLLGHNKQQLPAKKLGGGKELGENSMPVNAQRSASPKILGGKNTLGSPQQRITTPKVLGSGGKQAAGNAVTLSDAQQNRASLRESGRSNSTISALEKLTQNKAIEILGGDVSGKKSPIMRDKDRRSLPMSGPRPVLGCSRMVEENDKNFTAQTPSVIGSLPLLNEITKGQSSLATESNNSEQKIPLRHHESSTPSPDPKKSLQAQQKVASPTQTSKPCETKTASPELQTRLGQCTEESLGSYSLDHRIQEEQEQENSKQGQAGSKEERSSLEQGQDRLKQDQNGSDQGEHGSTQSRSVEMEINAQKPPEIHGSRCEVKDNDSAKDKQVTFSDKTDKVETNIETKHSVLDSSDIKSSSSQNSVDDGQFTSVNNAVGPNGTSDNTELIGNGANQTSFSEVASEGKDRVQGTFDNNADSSVSVDKDVASSKSGNSENKSDSFTESDKGGGEKKE